MQMTMTRLLTEIKTLKNRIVKDIQKCSFIAISKGKGDRRRMIGNSSISVAEVESQIKTDFQSVSDLIARLWELQRTKLRVNSSTIITNESAVITISDKVMTIAEAIEHKHIVGYKAVLLRQMKSQLSEAVNLVERENDRLNSEIDKAVSLAYQNDKGKIDESQYTSIAEPRRREHEAMFVDPLELNKLIVDLEQQIELFTTELDFTLSEVNARTIVEVS